MLEMRADSITGPGVEINTPRRTRKAGRVTRPVRQSFFREDVAQHRKAQHFHKHTRPTLEHTPPDAFRLEPCGHAKIAEKPRGLMDGWCVRSLYRLRGSARLYAALAGKRQLSSV